MDNIELKNELSFVLSKLHSAQRSCKKNKFSVADTLDAVIMSLEIQRDMVKFEIENEKKDFTFKKS